MLLLFFDDINSQLGTLVSLVGGGGGIGKLVIVRHNICI